jgi:hypothetical protein
MLLCTGVLGNIEALELRDRDGIVRRSLLIRWRRPYTESPMHVETADVAPALSARSRTQGGPRVAVASLRRTCRLPH